MIYVVFNLKVAAQQVLLKQAGLIGEAHSSYYHSAMESAN